MRVDIFTVLSAILVFSSALSQETSDAGILKTIAGHYYKNEKAIHKGRNQLLFFYCEKSNNNEEIYETVNKLKLPPAESKSIKRQVSTDVTPENWASELDEIYAVDKSSLKSKINACQSLEEYQEKQKKFNLNNQRLMIISKPVYYSNSRFALVKVVFYRSIEHNSGSVLLMENSNGQWIIREFLNPWST